MGAPVPSRNLNSGSPLQQQLRHCFNNIQGAEPAAVILMATTTETYMTIMTE